MPKMSGRVVARADLTSSQRAQMYGLFARYYDKITLERFEKDLADKDWVILMFDAHKVVQGFSTVKHLEVRCQGRVHRGLFSGDTVVAEEFWGQGLLGRLFLRHVFVQKVRHPFEPYWWFLISKGYKTYLLMANNCPEHYPRYEQETPPLAHEVLDALATTMFKDFYDRDSGLIQFNESLGQVKAGVAPISAEMLEHPRIRFFVQRNRTWPRGTELACIAPMKWTMPMKYAVKSLSRQWARAVSQSGQPSHAEK